MPRKKTTDYDNTSITTLKGADRVRKRPAARTVLTAVSTPCLRFFQTQ